MKRIEIYKTKSGKEPFSHWLKKLDISIQAHILNYVNRVARGASKNNIKNIGDQIFEIKITKGAAYRIYFSEIDNLIILLLLGGDNSSQKQDVLKAKKYWRQHNV